MPSNLRRFHYVDVVFFLLNYFHRPAENDVGMETKKSFVITVAAINFVVVFFFVLFFFYV